MLPEWEAMSPLRRAFEAVALPIAWGVVCGLLLAVSAPLYIAGSVFGVLGGIGGGAQHRTLREAMGRAAVGGTLFGVSILLGYALSGGEGAEVHLPEPQVLLLALILIPAFPLHALGWRLTRSRRAS